MRATSARTRRRSPTASRRLLGAELHDVRHRRAAGALRRQLGQGRQRRDLQLGRGHRPAIDQRPAAPFTGTSSTHKILTTVWTAGAAADLRPPATSPRTRSTTSGRASGSPSPTASWPTSTTSVPDDAAYQGQGQRLQRAALPGRPALGDRRPDHRHRQRHADRQRPRQQADARRRHRHHRGRRRQRHDQRRPGRGHDPFRRPAATSCATTWQTSTATRCCDFGFHASVDVLGSRIGRDSVCDHADDGHGQRRRLDVPAQRRLCRRRRCRRTDHRRPRQRRQRAHDAEPRELPARPARKAWASIPRPSTASPTRPTCRATAPWPSPWR